MDAWVRGTFTCGSYHLHFFLLWGSSEWSVDSYDSDVPYSFYSWHIFASYLWIVLFHSVLHKLTYCSIFPELCYHYYFLLCGTFWAIHFMHDTTMVSFTSSNAHNRLFFIIPLIYIYIYIYIYDITYVLHCAKSCHISPFLELIIYCSPPLLIDWWFLYGGGAEKLKSTIRLCQ